MGTSQDNHLCEHNVNRDSSSSHTVCWETDGGAVWAGEKMEKNISKHTKNDSQSETELKRMLTVIQQGSWQAEDRESEADLDKATPSNGVRTSNNLPARSSKAGTVQIL